MELQLGTHPQRYPLGTRVKTMKYREVKIKAVRVRNSDGRQFPDSDALDFNSLEAKVNAYLAYQLNSWMDFDLRSETFTYNTPSEFNIVESPPSDENNPLDIHEMVRDAVFQADAAQHDLVVIFIDDINMKYGANFINGVALLDLVENLELPVRVCMVLVRERDEPTRNIIIFFCFSCIVMAENSPPPEVQLQETQQVHMWEEKLEASRMLEPEEKIKALWLGLRNMGWRRSYTDHGEQVKVIYRKLQDELLSTPGHARYFAEEVERLIADPANAGVSVRERSWYLGDTLVHLPSPETIQVLGSYLYDERYTLDPNKDNSGALGPTYRIVARSIRSIGLREPQDVIRTEGVPWTTDKDIESIRRWWEEVKSGKRTFSFKGQAVEYRFLPDGTWETIPMENPPDDDPRKVVAVAVTPEQNDEPSAAQPPAPDARKVPRLWIWIGIAGTLLALVAGWRMTRRKSPA